mmetsp:Transcript_26382/g.55601  ORF Transcript_26382/g.55601 Transcript_26382/m.55601 type:complete len:129 (+) Transcript_26382:284-670(+)
MTSAKSYGAVEIPDNGDNFDEKNTYYLKEGEFKWARFFRGLFPVVIALLIMGGFAYGMSNGFNHFYGPSKSSEDDNSIKEEEDWVPVDSPSAASNNPLCNKNDKCAALGLEGVCCPTGDGVMLGCCDP